MTQPRRRSNLVSDEALIEAGIIPEPDEPTEATEEPAPGEPDEPKYTEYLLEPEDVEVLLSDEARVVCRMQTEFPHRGRTHRTSIEITEVPIMRQVAFVDANDNIHHVENRFETSEEFSDRLLTATSVALQRSVLVLKASIEDRIAWELEQQNQADGDTATTPTVPATQPGVIQPLT